MIQNEEPVIANFFWSATANPSAPCPELQADVSADVAILGAGLRAFQRRCIWHRWADPWWFWRRKRRDRARLGAMVGRSIRG